MNRWVLITLIALVSVGSGGCGSLGIDQVNLGLNTPAPGQVPVFRWAAKPGAAAYQVLVAYDRTLSQIAGQSGFTTDTQLSVSAIAWGDGEPIIGRTYFWVVRAYDRPETTGLMLYQSDPLEVTFNANEVVPPTTLPGQPSEPPTPSPTPSGPAFPISSPSPGS